ncbi:hypothetical protein F3Y22_tig00001478pilonHSYRG00547 [Hibiscus syriacus]|uniref:Uncharacterized protein n=1 Tax=Hibiscus syriacus TaxID=106335 RepID=A0A6A3CVD2_HIBSY|nr:hypothetical protein F3Y22_tig00001478pilonHSYRG00547 [Hibiscus syriacus]
MDTAGVIGTPGYGYPWGYRYPFCIRCLSNHRGMDTPAGGIGTLGGFGLARMDGQGQVANKTLVVGTWNCRLLGPRGVYRETNIDANRCIQFWDLNLGGHVWEETFRRRKASFGGMVWRLMMHTNYSCVVARLRSNRGFDKEEAEKVLH